MKIIHRYILTTFVRNLGLCLLISTILFLVFDFFDRVDIFLSEKASIGSVFLYFLYRIPLTIHLMLPVSVLVSTLFTIGMFSKNSEITAMRASGLTILELSSPILITGFMLSIASIFFNETVVPAATTRLYEVYNLDIRKKSEKGSFSQNNFWWREKDNINSLGVFDSRVNTMHDFVSLEISPDFTVNRRTDAVDVRWISTDLGWNMGNVTEYIFTPDGKMDSKKYQALPLPIQQPPDYFYNTEKETEEMGFFELRRLMKKLKNYGISTEVYRTDLYAKLSFPFVCFISILVSLPFAVRPARSGLAMSFIAGLVIGFSYYIVHAFSVAMGKAEFWNPLLAAWMANIMMGFIGIILNWGAEAP